MSSFPSFYQSIHEDEEEDAHSDRMRMAMMASLVATSSNTREYIDRGREAGQRLLMDDYWNPNPTYNARIFRRRFRMQRHLFNRIMRDVMAFDPYFLSTADAANKAFRKDVERAFGILQARWAIVRGPARLHDIQTLGDIMLACIIMHNMIVEDEYEERDEEPTHQDYTQDYDYIGATVELDLNHDGPTLSQYMMRHNRIRDSSVHTLLKNDLINHLWKLSTMEMECSLFVSLIFLYFLNIYAFP
ncbi:unnamed protein product [Cuscuta epithymum]|uniref:DDE Tnp4 domain-containing protein n=1 Tax=Cuscuta epithymum TaxID=186058 RepID=A0AAV0D5W9_9ASTE|nr:unnamed protein product [Cuscuta epithymum]